VGKRLRRSFVGAGRAGCGGAGNEKFLKCAESGAYGNLKKKPGKNQFDRDHIPSKAALIQKARELSIGRRLKSTQLEAIEKDAWTIAIPKAAHQQDSPTYGQSTNAAKKDAKDLAESVRRDVNTMREKIGKHTSKECADVYKQATEEVLKKTNKEYEDWLNDIIQKSL
jgi:hypothetical protein